MARRITPMNFLFQRRVRFRSKFSSFSAISASLASPRWSLPLTSIKQIKFLHERKRRNHDAPRRFNVVIMPSRVAPNARESFEETREYISEILFWLRGSFKSAGSLLVHVSTCHDFSLCESHVWEAKLCAQKIFKNEN